MCVRVYIMCEALYCVHMYVNTFPLSAQLHSCQEMLSTQLQNAVVELLSLLLSKDFAHLEKLKENFEASSQGKRKNIE